MRSIQYPAIALILGCSATPVEECIPVLGAVFEYRISPIAGLERFEFSALSAPKGCDQPYDSNISDGWLKTACLMTIIDAVEPTYAAGNPPESRFIYYVFRPDSPNVVYRHIDSGSSPKDPGVLVRDDILERTDPRDGGWRVCDGRIRRPAA